MSDKSSSEDAKKDVKDVLLHAASSVFEVFLEVMFTKTKNSEGNNE